MLSVHSCPLATPGTKDAGGMNVYLRELSRTLAAKGMKIDVFTRCTDPSQPRVVEYGQGTRVIRLKAGDLAPAEKMAVLNYLPEFVCNLRHFTEEYDLSYHFLSSHYWLSGWAGELLNARWNIPHTTMFHTLGAIKNEARPAEQENWLRISVERQVMNSVDAVVVATDDERERMLRLYQVEPDKVNTIPCGVDPEKFKPMPRNLARAQLEMGGDKVLLFVGRMEPLKGADLLIAALAQIPAPVRPMALLVGGEPQGNAEERRLRGLAAELGVSDRIRFVGSVPHEQLPLYYNAADAVVVPSHYESFGLVALEALACGIPVVAASVGGLTSFLRHEDNALLFSQHTTESLAEPLHRILTDEDLYNRLARRARPSIAHLSWEAIADRTIDLFRALARLRAPQPVCSCLA
jgi:D-inositol-3-phosphate glycosyltransferase